MVHPIVAQLTPSAEQLPAVRAEQPSVVVTAGAGAGKTRTLVARYLYLLVQHELPPRRIAAITFTRKAARQMRNQVRQRISHYLSQPLSADERDFWDLRYSQLDAARIGTIHQLCTEILRAHPAEARVDPRFEVLDEARSALLRTQAVERALAWAAESEEAVVLFALLGERHLRQVAEQLLQDRLNTREAFRGTTAELLTCWREALAAKQDRALQRLLADPAWQAHAATLRQQEPTRSDDRMAQQRALALAALAAAAAAPGLAEKREALADLDQINLSGGSQKAWPGGKEQLQEVKDCLRGLRELWQAQADVQALALTPVDEALAATLPALRQLWERADEAYRRLKEERQVVDFDDLEARALHLLQTDAVVRQRWQAELAAILVDEYQDTNSRQRDLVNLLHGDGNGLFIVGDAKQSIYRFRGAEVAVFRAERERIATGSGRAYNLAKSYRPHAGLLSGLNALLAAVMGTQADPGQPWYEPFAPLTHHREAPRAGLTGPYISLQLALGNKEEGLPLAARALAAEIARMVADDGVDVDYGDVAILCRASTSFGYYEDALDEWGIPYLTVAGRGFYERPEIRDLLNALRAVLDPTDDLALVGLLRSPVGGLTDAALYDLWRGAATNDAPFLWAHLAEGGTDVPLLPLLQRLHARAGREPVADLLKSFLDENDYRAALRQAGQQRALRNVEKLLALAHESGIVGVSEFLEYIEKVQAASGREGEARATAGNAVQIMSVHQAKGLEFPVVVVGDLNKSGGGRTSLLIHEEWGLLPQVKDEADNEPIAFSLAKADEEAQEAAEARRLLYVAATRAEDRLILNGNVRLTRSGRPGYLSGWLKELAGPLALKEQTLPVEDGGSRALSRELAVSGVPVGCTFYEPDYHPPRPAGKGYESAARLHHWTAPLLAPLPLPTVEPTDRNRRVWRVVPEKGEARRAPSWLIGALVHEALAAWRLPDREDDVAFAAWARARARERGLTDPRQIEHAVRQTLTLLVRFHGHSLYHEMDGSRRLHELPYTLEGEDGPEIGQVDVLYRRRDGRWHVVDFKTDRLHRRRQLAHVLAERGYEAQIQRYGRAVSRLLGETPLCHLCLLDCEDGVYLHPVSLTQREDR